MGRGDNITDKKIDSLKINNVDSLKKHKAMILGGVLAGSSIEFYDYLLTATVAALIWPRVFAPPEAGLWSYVLSMGLFAAGQVMRPVGAFLWGHLSDRIGRRNTLLYELSLMSIAMAGIALTPGYSDAGALSIYILLFFRLLQGLSMGGEYGTASSWLVEYAIKIRPSRRVLYGSFVPAAIYIGQFSASMGVLSISLAMSEDIVYSIGWRILYAIGLIAALAGLIIRLRLLESPLFIEIYERKALLRSPTAYTIRRYWRETILLSFISFSLVAYYYVSQSFALSYMKTMGMSLAIATAINSIALVIALVINYMAALLGDIMGRRPLIILGLIAGMVLSYPYMASIASRETFLIGVSHAVYYALSWVIPYAVLQTFIAEHYPTSCRASGTNIAYQTGNSAGGSLASILGAYIVASSGNPYQAWPYLGTMVTILTIPGLVAILRLSDTRERFQI